MSLTKIIIFKCNIQPLSDESFENLVLSDETDENAKIKSEAQQLSPTKYHNQKTLEKMRRKAQ